MRLATNTRTCRFQRRNFTAKNPPQDAAPPVVPRIVIVLVILLLIVLAPCLTAPCLKALSDFSAISGLLPLASQPPASKPFRVNPRPSVVKNSSLTSTLRPLPSSFVPFVVQIPPQKKTPNIRAAPSPAGS